jgi:hypothetical protein
MGLIAHFDAEPALGTTIALDDQCYELVDAEPYVRKSDGVRTRLLVWETACPVPGCSASFRVRSGLHITSLRRRCDDHALATKLVKGRRGRRIKVKVDVA